MSDANTAAPPAAPRERHVACVWLLWRRRARDVDAPPQPRRARRPVRAAARRPRLRRAPRQAGVQLQEQPVFKAVCAFGRCVAKAAAPPLTRARQTASASPPACTATDATARAAATARATRRCGWKLWTASWGATQTRSARRWRPPRRRRRRWARRRATSGAATARRAGV